jgi:metal-responsive CopG/Arc/MetJ family transcriptional regulator
MGRPPKEGGAMGNAFMLRLPEDLQEQVDRVAASLPDRKERSAAIRMLLREALKARGERR